MSDEPEVMPVPEPAPEAGWQEISPPLPGVGILAGLSERSLATLAVYGKYERYDPGVRVIQEGQRQDRFYVVVSGKLAISASTGGQEVRLSTAEPGECLGEVSVLEPGPASASVDTLEESVMWNMNLDNLRQYLAEHAGGGGALLLGMAQCLSERLRAANQLIGQGQAAPTALPILRHERAITAENTPVEVGFFDKLKRLGGGGAEKKVRISTEIKL
jgi:CRP-like cAMP-binding protein